jgi:hypothetical protein
MVVLKFAIGFFFLRIIIQPWQQRVIYGTLSITTVFGAAYFFISAFQCGVNFSVTPFWEKVITGQCLRGDYTLAFGYAHAAITILTDLICALLPIPLLWHSSLTKRSKKLVYGILGIAGMYVYLMDCCSTLRHLD